MGATEVSTRSWFSRLGKSMSGILGGLLVILGAVILLAWNEGRAVKTAKGLAEGAASVTSLDKGAGVNPALDGRLVHVTGMADGGEILRDVDFGMELPALKLRRQVEMLQWKEKIESKTRNKLGGGTETVTTHAYEKVWSDSHIDSSRFNDPENYRNPPFMGLESTQQEAREIKLGAFRLGPGLVSSLRKFTEVQPPEDLPEGYLAMGTAIFKSANPATPQIGDLRITFKAAMPEEVSVVARQRGDLLDGYKTATGTVIQMLEYGSVSAASMFESAKSANKTLSWGLRFLGFILLFIAAKTVLSPLAVLADVVPPAGRIVRAGTSVIAAVFALPVGLLTVAVAWLAYRPLLGISLIAAGIVLPVVVLFVRKKTTNANA